MLRFKSVNILLNNIRYNFFVRIDVFGAMTTTTHVDSFIGKQILSIGKIRQKFILFSICRAFLLAPVHNFLQSEFISVHALSYFLLKLEHEKIKCYGKNYNDEKCIKNDSKT